MIARRVGMNERQQKLASEYVPFARALARPFKNRVPSGSDDFESAACAGLVEAAIRFHPNRHPNFATYARRRIVGAIIDAWRNMRPLGYRANDRTEPSVISTTDWSGDEPSETPKIEDEVAYQDALDCWLHVLPYRLRPVFRSIYIENRSQSETAKALKLSNTYVSNLRQQAIDLLATRPDVVDAGLERGYKTR